MVVQEMSCEIFDYTLRLIREKGIDYSLPKYGGLAPRDIVFIKEMILGAPFDEVLL